MLKPLLLAVLEGASITIAAAAEVSEPPRAISSAAAPAATGPYSQAVLANDVLYVSGQLPLDPKTGQLVGQGIREQTRQVLANLSAVLAAANLTLSDVVLVHVFLADLDDFAAMNEIYGAAFKAPFPARFTVQVARLPRDARVEIGLTAVQKDE